MEIRHCLPVLALATLLPALAAAEPETNFSQRPGFPRHFVDNPSPAKLPEPKERDFLADTAPGSWSLESSRTHHASCAEKTVPAATYWKNSVWHHVYLIGHLLG